MDIIKPKPILTVNMTEAQWLQNRREGIGGSDVSVILGVNKYRTPFEMWLDKTGQTPIDTTETSEAIHFGNVFEEVVAQEFARRANKKVFKQNKTFIDPEYPMLRANIDRDVAHEDGFLECKTANAFLAKEWEGDEVPEAYLLQVQHYMNVLDRPYCYIAVLIGGQKFQYKRVERDQELIDTFTPTLVDWWNKHIIDGVPPDVDGSDAATSFLKDYLKDRGSEDVIKLNSDDFELLESRKNLKESEKAIKKELNNIDNHLKLELADVNTGWTQGYQVNYSSQSREGVDSKKLKKDYPDIYQKVKKVSSFRKLNIKEDKNNGN